MQDTIRPVRLSTHKGKGWKEMQGWNFASQFSTVPVASNELGAAVLNFPLAFVNPTEPTLIALLGFGGGGNLYLSADETTWLVDYVPAVLRAYPFKLLDAQEGQVALAFDEASGLLREDGHSQQFFGPDDRPTEKVQQTLQFLVGLKNGLQNVSAAAGLLRDLNLLEPWPLNLAEGDRRIPIEGLHRVNETAFHALNDEEFVGLRKGGALSVLFAQLLSMQNVSTFAKLIRLRSQQNAVLQQRDEEIKSMFVPAQADEDEIDWDAMLKDDKD